MKAQLVKTYPMKDEKTGKRVPGVIYKITDSEFAQEYADNTAPQYLRWADEEETQPLFFSRLYTTKPSATITLMYDNEINRYVSPELAEQREEYMLMAAFKNLEESI